MFDGVFENWFTWMMVSIGCAVFMQVVAKKTKGDVQPGMATKSDHFSMSTVFLSFKSGEALLFFNVLFITISFFLFTLGFSKLIYSLLPGT